MSDLNNKILIFIIVLIVGGGGFYTGTQYQKSKVEKFTGMGGVDGEMVRNTSGNHQGSMGRGAMGQGIPIAGEVVSKDDESITVEIQDGGSKIVFVSEETLVRKTEEGALNDLSVGTKVMVFGTESDDGIISATSIQIGTEFRFDRAEQ